MSKRTFTGTEKKCDCLETIVEEGELIVDESELTDNSIDLHKMFEVTENSRADPRVEAFFTEMGESNNFWNKASTTAEKLVQRVLPDEFAREPIWDVPLVGERIFFLNKSHSKWICVGLAPNQDFEPIVKIVGIKKQCVYFNLEEWEWFVAESLKLKKYYQYYNGAIPVINGMDIWLSHESFDGVNRIMKINKEGGHAYLAYESLAELWRMVKVVATRLVFLKDLKYQEFYNRFLDSIVLSGEEVDTAIERICNGQVSESVCVTIELVMYWLSKILNDLHYLRKNRL